MQSIDSIEICAYEKSKFLVSEKEEIECNNIIKKMIKFDDVTKENKKENNSNWPEISDHPCRMLIIGDSESR